MRRNRKEMKMRKTEGWRKGTGKFHKEVKVNQANSGPGGNTAGAKKSFEKVTFGGDALIRSHPGPLPKKY